jgi:phospholipid/cholesterol/gamma-HCH transport system permease protein
MMGVLDPLLFKIGHFFLFQKHLWSTFILRPPDRQKMASQIWQVSIQSFLATASSGFFVGSIMVIQFTLQMRDFDALAFLGGLSTSGTIRELGPLLIAFMLSGKVGAYTSAELGTMKITDQIDAMRCLGADPIQEIVLPRFIGIVTSSFFLLGLGLMMSILGGMLMGQFFAGVSPDEYIRYIPNIVSSFSIFSGLIKCFVFAIFIASTATYFGYHTEGGTKGVGSAVTQTAVTSMIGIVLLDWLLSFFLEVILISVKL